MEYKSVSALTDIARPRRGAGNQILAAYQVTTEGLNNPLSIDRLQVNFTPSPTLFDNVRLSTSTTPTDETVVAAAEGGILAVTSGNPARCFGHAAGLRTRHSETRRHRPRCLRRRHRCTDGRQYHLYDRG